MSCYKKVKHTLETIKGVKVTKRRNTIIIMKDNETLTKYDLKFIDYGKQNANVFIEYWKYRLKEER